MADRSTWLAHLPPVLWDRELPSGASLGEALRVFEKVFSGLDDDKPANPPITAGIAEAARQLDPWTARADFLPWLAGWVDLELPRLRDDELTDGPRRRAAVHRRRTVVARIAATYRRRGRPAGLADHVRLLHGGGERAPRIAVDDGARVLAVVPGDDGPAPVTALVTQGPVVSAAGALVADGIIRPTCVAVGGDGALFLGDAEAVAEPATEGLKLGSRIWRIDPDGRYRVTGPAGPTPFVTGLGSRQLRALAVAPPRAGRPETLYVLDDPGRLASVSTGAAPGIAPTTVAELEVAGVPFVPAAMVVDDRTGDLLVLVGRVEPGDPNPPQVVRVAPDGTVRTRKTLDRVTGPLSMLVEPGGDLLVGDGGEQTFDSSAGSPPGPPGNLVRVRRSGDTWAAETVLLPADRAHNPLVAPTGLVRDADGTLLVLDAGLRPLDRKSRDPFVCAVAEDPVVHRVDLDAPGGPAVAPASEPGRMVWPTGMVGRAGRLVVCDPGQPAYPGQDRRWTRLLPFWFEVVLHFAASRLDKDGDGDPVVPTGLVTDIQTAVERHKPAHTVFIKIN